MDRFGDEGAGVFPEDVETDARGSTPFEELLSQLDWARMRDDDESILSILELIMLKTLERFAETLEVMEMSGSPLKGAVLGMAIIAANNGGYLSTTDQALLDYLDQIPESLLRRDDAGRAYFPMLRSRARELERQRRHNEKRRHTTKPSSYDETVVIRRSEPSSYDETVVIRRSASEEEECTHSSSDVNSSHSITEPNTTNPVIGIPLRPAGARSVEHQAPSTVPGLLFPEMEEPAPEPEKAKKPRAPHPWEPLYQAVKEVTESDDRPSIRKFLWKVAYDLYHADPPYTPEEVLKLPAILEQQPWWEQSGKVISIAVLQKHIGLVRRVAEELPLLELPAMTLAELEREAIRSYRETIREGR